MVKTKWSFASEKMQVYCNTVPILPLLSFLLSHLNFLPVVIVLFGFANQPASHDFIQLVTVLCFSPTTGLVDWWSSQNTQTTQTSWMHRQKYSLFLDKGVISSSTCVSYFMYIITVSVWYKMCNVTMSFMNYTAFSCKFQIWIRQL
jgi:hypothetical protein